MLDCSGDAHAHPVHQWDHPPRVNGIGKTLPVRKLLLTHERPRIRSTELCQPDTTHADSRLDPSRLPPLDGVRGTGRFHDDPPASVRPVHARPAFPPDRVTGLDLGCSVAGRPAPSHAARRGEALGLEGFVNGTRETRRPLHPREHLLPSRSPAGARCFVGGHVGSSRGAFSPTARPSHGSGPRSRPTKFRRGAFWSRARLEDNVCKEQRHVRR